jgi:hypothetical protein
MSNAKKAPGERSRITRSPATKAPRAARKKKTLSDETLAELVGIAPPEPDVVEVASAPPPAPEPPPAPAPPIPWSPPREGARASSPWIGLDGRALLRAAARRVGRALERRFPLLGMIVRRFV